MTPRTWRAAAHEAVRTCSSFHSEYRILQPDGEVMWVEARGQIQPDAHGQAAFLNGVVVDISERKRADAALRHSEERYHTLFDAIDIGFCVLAMIFDAQEQPVDYRFIEINPAFERQTGLQDAVGKTMRELVPDLDQRWFEIYGRVATTGEAIHFEESAAAMNRVFDVHAFRTGQPQERRVALLFTDITQRRQQQRTLQLLVDLNEATQPLTDPDEIMVVTARFLGQFLEVNRCAYAQVEADQDHLTIISDYTRDTISVTGRFQLASFGEHALQLLRSGEPYIVEDVETDARTASSLAAYRRIEVAATVSVPLLKEGRLVAVMAVHQKVARVWTPDEIELIRLVINGCWEAIERARAVRDLRESEARLRFMAESMPQKIFTANAAGEVDYFNAQWMEFTGLSFEQIKDWGWTQFIHPDDVEENVRRWSQSIRTGEIFELEHRFRRADGEYRWHLSRAHAMRDARGKVLMWIGSNTDIDEVKQVESEKARLLDEAQEVNRLKDEFLATMSHELRTPMTAILGWTQLLRTGGFDEPTTERALQTVERNAHAQVRLINDLLDVSRIITGKLRLDLRPVSLASIVEAAVDSVQPTAEAKGIRLQTLFDTQVGLVSGDPDRLQQVVWNLLSNAIKFTPRQGRVRVSLEQVDSHVENQRERQRARHPRGVPAPRVRPLPSGRRFQHARTGRSGTGVGHRASNRGTSWWHNPRHKSRRGSGRGLHGFTSADGGSPKRA
jgi:PAS domain S-box-containing protein